VPLCSVTDTDAPFLLAGWSHDSDRVGSKLHQEAVHDSTRGELQGYDGTWHPSPWLWQGA
jgi:hypothetical protein